MVVKSAANKSRYRCSVSFLLARIDDAFDLAKPAHEDDGDDDDDVSTFLKARSRAARSMLSSASVAMVKSSGILQVLLDHCNMMWFQSSN